MFSTRTLAVLAVLATVAASPATDRPVQQPVIPYNEDIEAPWLSLPSFPLFGNFFTPLLKLFPSFDIGPRINADDDKLEIIVNVKDFKKEDLKVKVKGEFIFIQGSQEAKQDDRDVFASQFFHTYTLPVNASGADVTAQLTSDAKLVVVAPISSVLRSDKVIDREVPILETGKPFAKDEKSAAPTESTTVTELTTEDARKEPTTPVEREDVTEKDNVIPHGNDVAL